MDLGDYFIDADEVARNGEQFWAQNIRRYEDRTRRIGISASKASGLLRRGSVIELISSGSFVLNLADRKGAVTTITGDKGVYSQDRGTLVITGGVRAIQEGRSLSAGSIVYHLDSGRLEALGERPTITFEMRGE